MYSLKYKILLIFIVLLGFIGYFNYFYEDTFLKKENVISLQNDILGIEESIINKFSDKKILI
ncbi:Molybdenum cofactor biosynthesis protein A [Candidatus Arthromitus sp. SFB-5]|nr:Molybdenum cofactor biosynthesis protein A [Candidatus Arthromitus sp. SFB-5]